MRECVRVHQTKNGCLLSLCSLPFSIVLIHRCYSPTWPPSPLHRLLLKTQGRSTYFRPANQFPTQKRVQNRSNAKKDTRSLSGPSTLYFVRDQNNPKTRLSSSRAFERVMEKLAEKVVFPVCFLLWPVFFLTHRLFETCPNLFCTAAHLRSLDRVFFCWSCFCSRSSRLCVQGSFEYYSDDDWVKGRNLGFFRSKMVTFVLCSCFCQLKRTRSS